MNLLVVVHFPRSLNIDPAKLSWAQEWLRAILVKQKTFAVVLDATASGALSEWLHGFCAQHVIHEIVLAGDGVRYQYGLRTDVLPVTYGFVSEEPWAKADALDDADDHRARAIDAAVHAACDARAAEWMVWNVVLHDPASRELYLDYAMRSLQAKEDTIPGVAEFVFASYPVSIKDVPLGVRGVTPYE